jgi:hypothetical protein
MSSMRPRRKTSSPTKKAKHLPELRVTMVRTGLLAAAMAGAVCLALAAAALAHDGPSGKWVEGLQRGGL